MKLHFFTLDIAYGEFLRKIDSRVPYLKQEKGNRPFIGIVMEINETKYYAPLSSPKPKHLKMKNQIDFLKIDSGKLGCINFNNMIPVGEISLTKINLLISSEDTPDIVKYKNLLADQLSWCSRNKDVIYKKANKLYQAITQNRANDNLKNRCCDFKKLEKALKQFQKIKVSKETKK